MSETKAQRLVPEAASLHRVATQTYWHEQQAKVVVEAWIASQLSMRAFAASHGIHYKRIERWAYKLKANSQSPENATVRFLPVKLGGTPQALPTSHTTDKAGDAAMELRLPSGIVINLRPGFDGPALCRLLETLAC